MHRITVFTRVTARQTEHSASRILQGACLDRGKRLSPWCPAKLLPAGRDTSNATSTETIEAARLECPLGRKVPECRGAASLKRLQKSLHLARYNKCQS
jgi:hypothetical protein